MCFLVAPSSSQQVQEQFVDLVSVGHHNTESDDGEGGYHYYVDGDTRSKAAFLRNAGRQGLTVDVESSNGPFTILMDSLMRSTGA